MLNNLTCIFLASDKIVSLCTLTMSALARISDEARRVCRPVETTSRLNPISVLIRRLVRIACFVIHLYTYLHAAQCANLKSNLLFPSERVRARYSSLSSLDIFNQIFSRFLYHVSKNLEFHQVRNLPIRRYIESFCANK